MVGMGECQAEGDIDNGNLGSVDGRTEATEAVMSAITRTRKKNILLYNVRKWSALDESKKKTQDGG